jgi:polysaccharide deacetylase family protein (PEP-CTERM system associated)
MTVDVEDYFHASAFDRVVSRPSWSTQDSRVVQNTERLLECFDRAGIHATFFVLGWVAERFPRLVRDIAERGHEIASHGFQHQLIYLLTPDQFRDDIRRAKSTIEDAAGCIVRGYRAPSFSIVRASLWALDVLIEEGHSYDASIFPIRHDRYGIADAPRQAHRIDTPAGSIVEVPSSTVRLGQRNLPIAGGGYFRLLPYAWTRWGMARLNGAGEPAVFYIHPWEIDANQPRLPVGRLTALRHYHGLDTTLDRLETLCNDFAFDTVSAMLAARPVASVPAAARLAHAG